MESPIDDQRAHTEALMELVYNELRQVAQAYFRRQPPGFTLRPTEMVNEAYIHLMQNAKVKWRSPEHFRAVATRKIYQVVVDHLRQRNAQKRGGVYRRPRPGQATAGSDGQKPNRVWKRVTLDSVGVEWLDRVVDFLDLADALDELERESHRLFNIVMLHWFGGLTHAAAAKVLGVSGSTVEKDFRYALAWLNRRLAGAGEHAD